LVKTSEKGDVSYKEGDKMWCGTISWSVLHTDIKVVSQLLMLTKRIVSSWLRGKGD